MVEEHYCDIKSSNLHDRVTGGGHPFHTLPAPLGNGTGLTHLRHEAGRVMRIQGLRVFFSRCHLSKIQAGEAVRTGRCPREATFNLTKAAPRRKEQFVSLVKNVNPERVCRTSRECHARETSRPTFGKPNESNPPRKIDVTIENLQLEMYQLSH